MLPVSTDVLIVGAGPTGLTLAVALQQAGVDHLLIDKLPQGNNTSRAAVIHAHTLEALAPLGVTETLVARGLRLERFALRDRDRPLVQLRFDGLPSPHRYILMIPQDETERVLSDRLTALGGTVHRGVAATAVEQDDGRRPGDGRDARRRAPNRAPVTWWPPTACTASFAPPPASPSTATPTRDPSCWPTSGCAGRSVRARYRCSSLPAGCSSSRRCRTAASASSPLSTTRRKPPGSADIQALIDARGPAGPKQVETVIWSSRFRLHHRVARSYRAGRLLLMGDAAHVHSPAGGQGMNTGIVDAVVLGGMLADVVRGGRPDAWLDRYGLLRRPAAQQVIALASRLTAMATTRSPAGQAMRNGLLSVVGALPPARRRLEMNLSGLARRDAARLAA